MIDRRHLLDDLQTLLRTLEDDLLERSASSEVPEVGLALRAEYQTAQRAERTAMSFEDWRADQITQVAAAWVLSASSSGSWRTTGWSIRRGSPGPGSG